MKAGNVFLSIVVGVAAGVTAGVLFAPKKGSDTRKQIKDKSIDYAQGLQQKGKQLLNKGENYAEGLQEKYDGFIASMTAKYDSLMHQTEALATNGKARYEEAKKEVKNFNV
jgi:gas vesicle protein